MVELASDLEILNLEFRGPRLRSAPNSSLTCKDTIACSSVSSLPGTLPELTVTKIKTVILVSLQLGVVVV